MPHNDPTLLFTNAGMVQFKNVFTGVEQRPYQRATTSQKCVRAGGKHNDLDNVGYTARHHTFFEMLGNFSFGDYFKPLAIELAWNLVTKEFGLPADRLLATVYAEDDEAFDLWKKIAGLAERRIIRIATSDNFWAMGDTGPCGPCSEIFFDHGPDIPGGPPGSPDEDGDRFVEIWNLVFMQYEQVDKATRLAAAPALDRHRHGPRAHRGRAAGRARQLRHRPLPGADRRLGGADRQQGRGRQRRASHKVIADHLRASAFLIADGVMPANEGRGYVLRRIMRRGMRHAQLLGAAEPLLWRMVPVLVAEMGKAFPELVRAESADHRDAAARGDQLPPHARSRPASAGGGDRDGCRRGAPLPGEVAFKLYDTYGFPLDLTQDALRAQGRSVDTDGFDAAMAAPARGGAGGLEGLGRDRGRADLVRAPRAARARPSSWATTTDRGRGPDRRPGASTASRSTSAVPGQEVAVVVNQTPFYGESGGQIGDTGTIRCRRRGPARSPTRRSGWATCTSTSAGSRAARSASATRSSCGSTPRAATGCAAPTPPPTCCTRRCAATSART